MTGTPELSAQQSTASEPLQPPVAALLPVCTPTPTVGDLGFAKAKHLRKRADFERVYNQGRRHFSSHLTVFFRRREPADVSNLPIADQVISTSRVGFTVGRALGGAVDRNRLKRRMREAVRHEMAALTVPVDIVIHPKRSLLTVDFVILRKQMADAFVAVEQGKGAPPQPRAPRLGKGKPAKSAKPTKPGASAAAKKPAGGKR